MIEKCDYELSLRDVFYFLSCKIMSEFDKLYSYRIILIYLRDYNSLMKKLDIFF